jgi:hypothetical protein
MAYSASIGPRHAGQRLEARICWIETSLVSKTGLRVWWMTELSNGMGRALEEGVLRWTMTFWAPFRPAQSERLRN